MSVVQSTKSNLILPTSSRAGNRFVYRIAATAATSGLLFGFDTTVVNGALLTLRQHFALSPVQVEFAASSILYGCLAGALMAGFASDRFGRRAVLRFSGILFFLSAILAAIPATFLEFMLARILGGIAIGLASTVAPIYLAEVSPRNRRGSVIALNQLAIVSGILLAYCTNLLLLGVGAAAWRWMFGSAVIPAIALIVCLRFVPESPRWLLEKGRTAEADKALLNFSAIHRAEQMMETQSALATQDPPARWLRRFRKPILLAIGIAALQQMTGINTVLYYGSLLFVTHGNSGTEGRAFAANVLLGITNLVFTIVALLILNRFDRRHLLSGSAAVMLLALLLLVFAFRQQHTSFPLLVGSTMLYIAAFATGLGPAAWVYMAEIFPTSIRGRAMSIATTVLWTSCILVSNSFLTMLSRLGPSLTFGVYAGVCLVAVLFFLQLPETRGRTLEEIAQLWRA